MVVCLEVLFWGFVGEAQSHYVFVGVVDDETVIAFYRRFMVKRLRGSTVSNTIIWNLFLRILWMELIYNPCLLIA